MEDILSILVIVLIAVASVSKKNRKKKAKAPDSKGPARFDIKSDKGFGEMKEFIKDVGKTVLEMEDDDFSAPAKLKAKKMNARSAKKTIVEPEESMVKPASRSARASIIEEGLGTAPVRSSQGFSLFEDKGCVGGSIAHDSHEGDSKYPYGTSGDRAQYGESAYAEDIAQELQSMNVQRLRRAVVVAEILDRPKALRRR